MHQSKITFHLLCEMALSLVVDGSASSQIAQLLAVASKLQVSVTTAASGAEARHIYAYLHFDLYHYLMGRHVIVSQCVPRDQGLSCPCPPLSLCIGPIFTLFAGSRVDRWLGEVHHHLHDRG
jgi:hypothetical protein